MSLLRRLFGWGAARREADAPAARTAAASPAAIPVHVVGDPTDARRSGVPPLAVEIVAHFEGLRLSAYLCPAGVWTIGYGSTRIYGRAVRDGDRLRDEAEARALLARDLADASEAVDAAVQVPLLEHERAALISAMHNIGPGRADAPGRPGRDGLVRLRGGQPSTMLRRLNAGDRIGAAEALLAWTRGGGAVLPGLVRRRATERAMFLGGDWRSAMRG